MVVIMDLQKIIKDVLAQLEGNDALIKEFLADPVKTLEKKLGVDLPDDKLQPVIDGIQAKLKLDEAADTAKNILGAVQGLFGKK